MMNTMKYNGVMNIQTIWTDGSRGGLVELYSAMRLSITGRKWRISPWRRNKFTSVVYEWCLPLCSLCWLGVGQLQHSMFAVVIYMFQCYTTSMAEGDLNEGIYPTPTQNSMTRESKWWRSKWKFPLTVRWAQLYWHNCLFHDERM